MTQGGAGAANVSLIIKALCAEPKASDFAQ